MSKLNDAKNEQRQDFRIDNDVDGFMNIRWHCMNRRHVNSGCGSNSSTMGRVWKVVDNVKIVMQKIYPNRNKTKRKKGPWESKKSFTLLILMRRSNIYGGN